MIWPGEVNDTSPYTYRANVTQNSTFATFSCMSTANKVSNEHYEVYFRFEMDTPSIYGLISFGT